MSTGLIILTAIAGAGIVLIIYLLFVPIKFRLNLRVDNGVSAITQLTIFPFEHKFVGKKKKEIERRIKVPKKIKAEKPGKGFDLSRLEWADSGLITGVAFEGLKFAGRLIASPHYSLKADFSGGASEPDITGEIYGAYQAVVHTLPGSISIRYRPDFTAERLVGTVELGLACRLVKLLRETLILIFRLPIIKLIKLYRKLRKGG